MAQTYLTFLLRFGVKMGKLEFKHESKFRTFLSPAKIRRGMVEIYVYLSEC